MTYTDDAEEIQALTGFSKKKQEALREKNSRAVKAFGNFFFIRWSVRTKELISEVLEISGEESYEEYENNIKSSFYQDICISDILDLSHSQVSEIQNQIAEEFGILDNSNIK